MIELRKAVNYSASLSLLDDLAFQILVCLSLFGHHVLEVGDLAVAGLVKGFVLDELADLFGKDLVFLMDFLGRE